MKQYSSIFNDVLGPVMNGPSSSHTAASARIGMMMKQMVPGKPVKFTAYFDKDGALASCYHEQWVDYGLIGGLLGMYPDDDRLADSFELAENAGLKADFIVTQFPNDHPNTYIMQVTDEFDNSVDAVALSVGGGMVEVIEVEGFKTNIGGGFYETLIFVDLDNKQSGDAIAKDISGLIGKCIAEIKCKEDGKTLINVKTENKVSDSVIEKIKGSYPVSNIIFMEPILPVTSQIEPHVPFIYAEELLEIAEKQEIPIWKAAVMYESERGGVSESEVFEKMKKLVKAMKASLEHGLKGTYYDKRILGAQSKYLSDPIIKSKLIKDDITNSIIESVSAIMEVKSSLGVFVAAPTAGACGSVTGTVLGVAKQLGLDDEQIVKAMFAAGIIGVFISERATFAAEVAGCQAECGSGSGMAAAALVQLMNGTAREACSAASMALQNTFGMTCDPVAMGVESPCLGKNVLAGVNALTSANMALAGFNAVIPLDETVDAFNEAGRMIPHPLRCTGGAGITMTPTAKKIEEKFKNNTWSLERESRGSEA